MKRMFVAIATLCVCVGLAFPRYAGDMNGDRMISISDLTMLVDIMMGRVTSYDAKVADANGDGKVTMADVDELVQVLLGKAPRVIEDGADTIYIRYANGTATYEIPTAWQDYVSVEVDGGDVTVTNTNITDEYVTAVSGTCSSGSFVYNGTYKTTVVLAGVTLTNPNGAAINIQCGKRTALELKEGTTNELTDCTGGPQKAALYCKGHLEISKGGALTVTGLTKHAISSKEYMLIKKTTGSITINGAESDGIHAGQYFQMNGGTLTISNAGGDGIQAEATLEEGEEQDGQFIVNGGTIAITLTGDDVAALKSDSLMTISNGNITVTTSGSASKGMKSKTDITITGGTIDITQTGSYLVENEDASYTTAIKADGMMTMTDGTLTIDNTADGGKGISADGNIDISGGTVEIDANGAGGTLDLSNTPTTPTASYRLYVTIPTSQSQGGGGFPGGQQQSAWGNVYLYDSSNNLIAQLTNQATINSTNFYYYDFGEATSGTYYFKSDDYSGGGGGGFPGSGGGRTYTIITSNISLSLTGTDKYYSISNQYSTSGTTRTYSISDVTSTYAGYSPVETEGDTYKSACLKSDSDIMISGGQFTLNHSGTISKGMKADGTVTVSGGTITDNPSGGYMVVGSDPAYCTAIKCNNYRGTGGTMTVNASGTAARGLSADNTLEIDNGEYNITLSGHGSTYTGNNSTEGIGAKALKSDGDMILAGGTIVINSGAKGGKGIKIGNTTTASKLTIGNSSTMTGPTLTVTTTGSYLATESSSGGGFPGGGGGMDSGFIGSAKAIKCMGDIEMYGGEVTISTATDGAEGMESKANIHINGGKLYSKSSDDCMNATGSIYFDGGVTVCYSDGNDAVDSNAGKTGAITIGNGVVFAYTSNGDPEEGLDCDNNSYIQITGTGIAISAGGSQGGGGGGFPGGGSSGSTISNAAQGYYFNTSSYSYQSGQYYTLADASGNNLVTFSFPTGFTSNLSFFTATGMRSGSTYAVKYSITAPTNATTEFHGLYLGSSHVGTSSAFSFTAQ